VASPRPAYQPPGVWPPAGRNWCFLVTYLKPIADFNTTM
jgi:hypothetical protein